MLWFYLFIVSIAVGGFFALLVAVARTPGLANLFPPEYFYHALVGHVDSALIIGLYAFLIFLWHRVFKKEDNLLFFFPGALGFLLIVVVSALGLGQALWNNYVPTVIHPLFLVGISLFFLSVFLNALRFSKEALKNFYVGTTLESVLSTTVINSLLFPITLLASYIITPKELNPYRYYEALFWFPGHIHQFVNAGLLLSLWFLLLGEGVINLRFLNTLLLTFPGVYLIAQFFMDPLSEGGRVLTKWGYAVGIGLPTIIYGVLILTKSLRRRDFYRLGLSLSVLIYFVGALMGYLIVGMDTRVPAHYHGVIASILVAVMVLTFKLLQEFGYVERLGKFIKSVPFLYGFGMLMFVAGLFWAGVFGAPRKMPGTEYIQNVKVYLFMILMGVGSILSVLGGASFVLFVLKSFLGRVRNEKEGREGEEV
ncbi:hypothetical protein JCM9492_12190 [Aquifex pyrophilus]